jgi:hypothetical protein
MTGLTMSYRRNKMSISIFRTDSKVRLTIAVFNGPHTPTAVISDNIIAWAFTEYDKPVNHVNQRQRKKTKHGNRRILYMLDQDGTSYLIDNATKTIVQAAFAMAGDRVMTYDEYYHKLFKIKSEVRYRGNKDSAV